MQEHRQRSTRGRKVRRSGIISEPQTWELLRILWGADEEQKKIKRLEVE
jgi:hypothetical protein